MFQIEYQLEHVLISILGIERDGAADGFIEPRRQIWAMARQRRGGAKLRSGEGLDLAIGKTSGEEPVDRDAERELVACLVGRGALEQFGSHETRCSRLGERHGILGGFLP